MSERLRPSTAKMLLDMPPAAVRYRLSVPFRPTPAMEFGTEVDAIVFGSRVAPLAPTGASIAAGSALECLNRLKSRHNASGFVTQRTLEWDSNAVLCRGTPDAWIETGSGGAVIVDLKTCRSASSDAIEGAARRFKYDLQLAAYREALETNGIEVAPFAYIVWVESSAPYLSRVSLLTPERLDGGKRKWHRAREIWRRCVDSGVWPGYEDHELI